LESKKNIHITKVTKKINMVLELAVRNGETVIIENIAEKLDSIFDPILRKEIITSGGYKCVTIGNTLVEFHKDFKLF